jgi:hypothetical protein
MVAYVGDGAEDYLPSPKGIELICWDKEGSTNADTIRKLPNDYKVNIWFAKNLHAKIY